jgi:hypothetical protein
LPARRGRARARPSAALGGGTAGAAGRILIDGRNVQHALARGRESTGPGAALPTVTLVAQLRAAFLPPTEVELILDGHAGGGPSGRLAPGFTVTYSRHASADAVIGDGVAEALLALGPAAAWSVVVVSDDREVRDHARRNGARVEGTAWLGDRLGATARVAGRPGTGLGHGRPPKVHREPPLG